jgi:hypothetical protein
MHFWGPVVSNQLTRTVHFSTGRVHSGSSLSRVSGASSTAETASGSIQRISSIFRLASTAPMPKQDQFCDSRHLILRYQFPTAIDAQFIRIMPDTDISPPAFMRRRLNARYWSNLACYAASAAGSGRRPRMRSAPFSAIISTQALMCAETRSGIDEASQTRKPSMPCTLRSGSRTPS